MACTEVRVSGGLVPPRKSKRRYGEAELKDRPWIPPMRWIPPLGHEPYLTTLASLPLGRPYGLKVIVAYDTAVEHDTRKYPACLVGRIASPDAREWVAIRDNEVLVDFGTPGRGLCPFPRRNLLVDK